MSHAMTMDELRNGDGRAPALAGDALRNYLGADERDDDVPAGTPRPVPLNSARPPELPAGIVRGWLGDMVDAVSASKETPPELAVTFGFAALSAVVQQRFSIRIRPDYFEPLNVWPLCALEPGNRKTGVMLDFTGALLELERQWCAELTPQIDAATSQRKSAEARVAHLREQAKKKGTADAFQQAADEVAELESNLPSIPTVPILFSQDVTPEHTATMLADNGQRLALISDEAGIFDQMGGKYNGGLPNLDVYLQAHAGGMVKVHRGSRPPVVLSHPTLTIALSPQPDVLKGLSNRPGFRGRGLLARFMWMVPLSRLGYRTGDGKIIDPTIRNAYRDAIHALAGVQPDRDGDRPVPHVLYFSDDAYTLWRAFWAEVEEMMRDGGELYHLTDWGGKLPGLVARIAGLLHLADFASAPLAQKTVDLETVDRAVTFARYLIEHARIAFGVMGADSDLEAARHLWTAIRKRRLTEFSARDAWQMVRGRYPRVEHVDGGFDVLIDHAYIIEPPQADDAPRRRGRPPARRFKVNPYLTTRWGEGDLCAL